MNRSTFLATFVFALLVFALATAQGSLLILAVPLALYLIFGMLSLPEENDLDISRSLNPERADPNEPVAITVTIRNRGPELTEALIEDVLPSGIILHSGSPRRLFT
ncbi:MAG: hypothetical protein AB1649_33525, partial [Chloroflexota bacterium]